jgi:hypothetical protein
MSSQQMMWSAVESLYRGQATDGTVVTVEEPAMMAALKQAGKGIFDTDWWQETLPAILERWGLTSRRWIDEATDMPRAHYRLGAPTEPHLEEVSRLTTGSLSERLLARKKEQ